MSPRIIQVTGDLRVLTVPPPTFPAAVCARVDEIWHAETLRRGDALFEAPVLCALSHRRNAIQATSLPYRYVLAQLREPQLHQQLHILPLAVAGIVISGGGALIGRRGPTVSQHPGSWELVPSGGLETADFRRQFTRELQEEVGIKAGDIRKIALVALLEDSGERLLEIGLRADLDPHVRNRPLRTTPEYVELQWLELSELTSFLCGASAVVPASLALALAVDSIHKAPVSRTP